MSKPLVTVHTETLQETIFGNDATVTIHLVEVEQEPTDFVAQINFSIKGSANQSFSRLEEKYGTEIATIIEKAIETAI